VRLSISWFGTRKTLNAEQKAQAADTFGAEGEFLSAGKKLIDTRHPAFKAESGEEMAMLVACQFRFRRDEPDGKRFAARTARRKNGD
jgi:hypothetical protein